MSPVLCSWEQAKLHREVVNVLVHVGLIDIPLAIRLATRIAEHSSTGAFAHGIPPCCQHF